MNHLWRRVALILGSVLLMLFILEVGLRFYFSQYGTQDEKIAYLYTAEEIQNLQNQIKPLPYVTYAPNPAFPEHNKLGYRGEAVDLPKPQGVFRIAALGGSTTYGPENPEHAYPHQLELRLHELGYTQVEVINAGVIGYTSWESFINFAFRVLTLEPDIILIYHATNDVIPRVSGSEDCYQGENELRGLNLVRGFWVERDENLPASVLLRFLAIQLGWLDDPTAFDSSFSLPRANCALDPVGITPQQRIELNPPVYFERNMRNLAGLAQFNNVQPVFSTWAYDVENEERPPYWRQAIAEHNEIIQDIATNLDVPLIDFANTLTVNPDYWSEDGIHMQLAGTIEQARQYADFLIENDLLPPVSQ